MLRRLTSFLRRDDGSIAVETVILLPVLFWTYLSMFSIFDAFRQYSINQKAAFTIGDMISRETLPLDDLYITGAHDLFGYLTNSRTQNAIRVTSVYFDAETNSHEQDWSIARGGMVAFAKQDPFQAWDSILPIMKDGERIMVVETRAFYDPPFSTGLEDREITNLVFTRPRYAPRVCWLTCD